MAELSAREAAYQMLRQRIITMDLKPGDPLNDRERLPCRWASAAPHAGGFDHAEHRPHGGQSNPKAAPMSAPIDLNLMEQEQFARFTLEKRCWNACAEG